MNSLKEIEADIWEKASVNREHILQFLSLQDTSDSATLRQRTEEWLTKLHDDPYYDKVHFPVEQNEMGVPMHSLSRVLDDLSNYGRIGHETIIGSEDTRIPPHSTGGVQ